MPKHERGRGWMHATGEDLMGAQTEGLWRGAGPGGTFRLPSHANLECFSRKIILGDF